MNHFYWASWKEAYFWLDRTYDPDCHVFYFPQFQLQPSMLKSESALWVILEIPCYSGLLPFLKFSFVVFVQVFKFHCESLALLDPGSWLLMRCSSIFPWMLGSWRLEKNNIWTRGKKLSIPSKHWTLCFLDIGTNTDLFIPRHVESFAGNIYTSFINFQGTGISTLSKVKEVPWYQDIVALRRQSMHPPVLTYSLISRQLALVHRSQHSMNLHPVKTWKLRRTYHWGVASRPSFLPALSTLLTLSKTRVDIEGA